MLFKQYFHAENDDLNTSIDVEIFENGAKIVASSGLKEIVVYLTPDDVKELAERLSAFLHQAENKFWLIAMLEEEQAAMHQST